MKRYFFLAFAAFLSISFIPGYAQSQTFFAMSVIQCRSDLARFS
jgi:hypothetical protein